MVLTDGAPAHLGTPALFAMIGADPCTDWLDGLVALDPQGFVLTGPEVGRTAPYEPSQPGVFAIGDVRSGPTKRVAAAVGEGSVVVQAIPHVSRHGISSRFTRPATTCRYGELLHGLARER